MPAYSRPSKDTATGRVWQIADEITHRTGRKARRGQVISAYLAEGGNPNTASTQYYYWNRSTGSDRGTGPAASPPVSSAAPDDLGPVLLHVDAAGRMEIPPQYLAAVGVGPDGRLTARIEDGELRLIASRMALTKLRDAARALVANPGSVVEEFLAEKRREAARE